MLVMIIGLVEPMNKILFGQILLTVITVFVIFMSIYSTIPKIRKKYQGRTVHVYCYRWCHDDDINLYAYLL